MKTAVQSVLLVFLAVAFCGAQIEWDIDFPQNIMDCQHSISGSGCDDLDKTEECLKNIVPRNRRQRNGVQQQLNQIDWHRTSCPGLNTNEECISSNINECFEIIHMLKVNDNKEACNHISTTRDCLTEFNATCTRNVVLKTMKEIDDIEEKCTYGHYDHCTREKAHACTLPVYLNSTLIPFDFGLFDYKCDTVEVTAAFDCLDKLTPKCPKQPEEITEALNMLDGICPDPRYKIQE